jgi:hypothetical protein
MNHADYLDRPIRALAHATSEACAQRMRDVANELQHLQPLNAASLRLLAAHVERDAKEQADERKKAMRDEPPAKHRGLTLADVRLRWVP